MLPLSRQARLLASTAAAGVLVISGDLGPGWLSGGDRATRTGTLVAYEPLPTTCVMPSAEQRTARRQEYVQAQASARASSGATTPVRRIKDPYASFAGVAVDPVRDEVVFTDESLFQILVYDRLENTPAGAQASRPKRVIVGEKTNIEFQSSVWVDSKTGEIYAVNNDTRDTTVVFGAGATGDAAPVRSIHTPHGSFAIAAAEAHDEVLMTIQHDSAIVTYKKTAGESDQPTRLLQGLTTKLADPHGIAYDPADDVIFVANFGATHDVSPGEARGRDRRGRGRQNWPLGRNLAVPGSGTIGKPSITVYRRLATGGEAPLRIIEGPATQLNWPTGIAFDPTARELYVANDMGPSVLVFDARSDGKRGSEEGAERAEDRARESDSGFTGPEEPGAVGREFRRPLRHRLRLDRIGGHAAETKDSQRT